MRVIRSLTIVFGLVVLSLALLHGAVHTATGSNAMLPDIPQDEAIVYTRVVTGIIYASANPLTPALTSLWQTQYYSVSGPFEFPVAVVPPLFPADAEILTYSMTGGHITRVGNVITYNITDTVANVFFDYRTNQQAVRQNNLIQIDQVASANLAYRYSSTLFFTQPYQFAGFVNQTPTIVDSHTLSWGLVPPYQETPGGDFRYRFDSTVWLIDPRVNAIYLPVVLKNH